MRPFDYSKFIEWRGEFLENAKIEACRKKALLAKANKVFKKYGIKRAYLFGSVCRGSCFSDSDIDVYVEDLDPASFWSLWRELEEVTSQCIDLYYQLDDPVFTEKVKTRGEVIYEG